VCGIFGAVNPAGITPPDHIFVDRMGKQLLHRGPDGSGLITEHLAYLGIRRARPSDPPLSAGQPQCKARLLLGHGQRRNYSTNC